VLTILIVLMVCATRSEVTDEIALSGAPEANDAVVAKLMRTVAMRRIDIQLTLHAVLIRNRVVDRAATSNLQATPPARSPLASCRISVARAQHKRGRMFTAT